MHTVFMADKTANTCWYIGSGSFEVCLSQIKNQINKWKLYEDPKVSKISYNEKTGNLWYTYTGQNCTSDIEIWIE